MSCEHCQALIVQNRFISALPNQMTSMSRWLLMRYERYTLISCFNHYCWLLSKKYVVFLLYYKKGKLIIFIYCTNKNRINQLNCRALWKQGSGASAPLPCPDSVGCPIFFPSLEPDFIMKSCNVLFLLSSRMFSVNQ